MDQTNPCCFEKTVEAESKTPQKGKAKPADATSAKTTEQRCRKQITESGSSGRLSGTEQR